MNIIKKNFGLRSPLNGGASFTFSNRVTRIVWQITWLLLASWTPIYLHPWRRFLLRLFGSSMGQRSDVRGSARVWLPSNLVMGDHSLIGPRVNCYNQGMIKLGDFVLVSQGAHLCAGTHDIDDPEFGLITKKIFLGDFSWVAADTFLGPGSSVSEGAVLGARGVAFGKLEPWTVYIGNPAKPVRKRIKTHGV